MTDIHRKAPKGAKISGAAKAAQDRAVRNAALLVQELIPDLEYYQKRLTRIAENSAVDAEHVTDDALEDMLSGLQRVIDGCRAQVAAMPAKPTIDIGEGFRS